MLNVQNIWKTSFMKCLEADVAKFPNRRHFDLVHNITETSLFNTVLKIVVLKTTNFVFS